MLNLYMFPSVYLYVEPIQNIDSEIEYFLSFVYNSFCDVSEPDKVLVAKFDLSFFIAGQGNR